MAKITACRSCDSPHLTEVLDLGLQPVANALRTAGELAQPEEHFPLAVAFCHGCTLLQVTETVPAEVLFGRDYPYYSSFSPAALRHSREHALALIRERGLNSRRFVVEVAGNDGYLLRNFAEAGVRVLNIDPATGPADAAKRQGIPTVVDFFNEGLAKRLSAETGKADVILANNVAAHVDRINEFMAGFPQLLADDGIVEIEVAYLRDLIDTNAFDTIYHEHLFYYSIRSFEALVQRHGLHLNDAQTIGIHGGSIRLRLSRRPGTSRRLRELKAQEAARGMHRLEHYVGFAGHVGRLRERLLNLLAARKVKGDRIAAYGAAAKGATLLNYAGIDDRTIDYVVDRNVHKVGKFMPGAGLPIFGTGHLLRDRPDLVLLLAWNFADEILAQEGAYLRQGGAFVIPVPEPRIVGAGADAGVRSRAG